MQLALCIFKYFPYGGMQRDFLRVAILLAKNHSVQVFTTAWQGEIPSNVTVHLIEVTKHTNHARMQEFAEKTLKKAHQCGCKRIVGFNKMPGLDVYFAADNCYVKQAKEDHGWLYRLMPRYKIYKSLEESVFSSKSHTKILFLAEKQKQSYQQVYQTPEEITYLLPVEFNKNHVNLREKAIIRASHGVNADDYFVLMVCSAFKTKGVDHALHALSRLSATLLKKTRLLIIGDDKPASFLYLAKRLGIESRVQFLGARKDILDYMCAADLFLHPARKEAGGKVLLEAMSCGLPIVTTFECGYAEHIIKADAGIVLSKKHLSNEILSNSIAWILNATDETKAKLRKQALDYVAHYPVLDLAEETVKIIENL